MWLSKKMSAPLVDKFEFLEEKMVDELRKEIAIQQKKRIAIYHGIGDHMASDNTCVNFRYQYEYEKFIGILLFMPIITAGLAHW